MKTSYDVIQQGMNPIQSMAGIALSVAIGFLWVFNGELSKRGLSDESPRNTQIE